MNCSIQTELLPFIISPQDGVGALSDWAKKNRSDLSQILAEKKAILFRGFGEINNFEFITSLFFDELLTYNYRSTSRKNIGKNLYTSTEYPQTLSIPQHCENSYQRSWPLKLLFHCILPAARGGETPLADMVHVTQALHHDVKNEFKQKKVKYVRNFKKGIDLPWSEVFGTTQKREVEIYCQQHDIDYQWFGDELRTSQVCEAFATHPLTKQALWFNQAHLFHITAFDKTHQAALLHMFGEEGLPRNTYFGDGTQIDHDYLEHIRYVFQNNIRLFPWKKNDLLLVDNMLVSHGRTPYEGKRKIVVCMAEPYPTNHN